MHGNGLGKAPLATLRSVDTLLAIALCLLDCRARSSTSGSPVWQILKINPREAEKTHLSSAPDQLVQALHACRIFCWGESACAEQSPPVHLCCQLALAAAQLFEHRTREPRDSDRPSTPPTCEVDSYHSPARNHPDKNLFRHYTVQLDLLESRLLARC